MNEHIRPLDVANPQPPGAFFTRWASFVPPRYGRDFSGAHIAGLFALITLIAAIPVITYPMPPLEDYLNHLARMHVIAEQGRDANLARFYEIDWDILPNLMMDLVVPTLARVMNVYLAGQIFLIITFGLMLSGALACNRALFGRWSVLPLVGAPFLYNYVFLIGVVNYLFGIGLALWALAAWVALRDRAPVRRLAVSALFVVALFFCHLFAVGVYGVGILAYEVWRLFADRSRPLPGRLLSFVAGGLPFLAAVPLLLTSPTLAHAGDFEWESNGKIDGLQYVIELYSDVVALTLAAAFTAAAIWATRQKLLRAHPFCFALLGVGGLVYIGLPRVMFSTYMADQRLPIALAFMVLACLQLEVQRRSVRRGFLGFLVAILVLRVLEVDVVWAQLSPEVQAMHSSVKKIAPGSTVLVAYGDPTSGDESRDLGLVHAACIAIIERSALVSTAFTVQGKQVMHVTPNYRGQVDTEDDTPPSVSQLVLAALRSDTALDKYWHDWPQRFDYVYVLFSDDDQPNPAPDFLAPVYSGDRFQLYKVRKPH